MNDRCPKCGDDISNVNFVYHQVFGDCERQQLQNELAQAQERIAELERERNKLKRGIRKLVQMIDRELGVKE